MDKFSKTETELSVKDNSLYAMTRHSQNCFTHKIDKEESLGVRYSLTFRSVGNVYRRSTIIIGDSNTKNLSFGEGKGTFGKGLPGKREEASKVEHIIPLQCLSYSNVVISCGVNNIREGTGRHRQNTADIDVDRTFNEFKQKVDLICKLKKNIIIFICPILPTRSTIYNARAIRFNNLIHSQIIDQNYYKCTVIDVLVFCDSSYNTDLLDHSYSRGDLVHLNGTGIRKFANIIKDSIYRKYNSGKGNRINSRKPYSVALTESLGVRTPTAS